MAFGNQNKSKGGSKKGPRAHQLSHKNKQVKLRPQPEKPFNEAKNDKDRIGLLGTEGQLLDEDGQEDEGEESEEEECSCRKETQIKDLKPLIGKCLSVSGCLGLKADLLHKANELGAKVESSLLNHVTHLITDSIGSDKYEAAVFNSIKIMNPDWIPAIRKAWTSGDNSIDFDQLEFEHTRKPLEGLTICTTGFAQGSYKDSFRQLLADNGAYVTPSFLTTTDILIVASPTSPHSQRENFEKIKEFQRHPNKYPNCSIVWENWAREAIRIKGIRVARKEFWRWTKNGLEPIDDGKALNGLREKRNMLAVSSTMGPSSLMMVDSTTSTSTSNGLIKKRKLEERDTNGDILIPINRKKSQLGFDSNTSSQLFALDSLKNHYTSAATASASASTSTSKLPLIDPTDQQAFASTSKLSRRTSSTKNKVTTITEEEASPYIAPDSTGFAAIGSKGKSVIKALSTSRSTSFLPVLPRTTSTSTHLFSKDIAGLGEDYEGDDSAFFDGIGIGIGGDSLDFENIGGGELDEEVEEEEDLPIFEGVTVSMVGLGETADKVKEAIEKRGGKVWIEKRMREADWICVPHICTQKEYRNSEDPRIITPSWVEMCSFQDRIITKTEDLLLAKPIPYDLPIPGGEKLLIHPSGFTAPEAKHIKRFVEAIGGNYSDTLTKEHTHMILFELNKTNDETMIDEKVYKVRKCREWGVEIVGIDWLKEFGRKGAEIRDREIENEKEREKKGSGKGKGKEFEKVSKENSSRSSRDTSIIIADPSTFLPNQQEDDQLLAGCTVLVSKQCDSRRKELTDIVNRLGGDIVPSYSKEVTHLIHVGTRRNESFKDFKSAKTDRAFVVHSAWIDDTLAAHRRLSEADYPHTYDLKKGPQLSGLVSSPNRLERTTSMLSGSQPSTSNSRLPSRTNSIREILPSVPANKSTRMEVDANEEEETEKEDNEDQENQRIVKVPPRLDTRELDRILAGNSTSTSTTSLVARRKSLRKSLTPPPLPTAPRVYDEEDWNMEVDDQGMDFGNQQDLVAPINESSSEQILPQAQIEEEPPLALETSSVPANVLSPGPNEPSSDDLADTTIPFHEEDLVDEVAGVLPIPPPTARTLLKEQTSAMLASFEKEPVETGVKKARFGRKKSLVDSTASDTSNSNISPMQTRLPIVEPLQETQFSQWEEESMCVRYEDPNSKAIMEKIQAALKAPPKEDSNKRNRSLEQSLGEDEGESLRVAEGRSLKRTRGSSRRS